MRYTRYNYKKKKNNGLAKFILSFVAMSAFVVVVGVLLANIIIYFLPINNASKDINKVKVEKNSESGSNETDKTENKDAEVNGENVVDNTQSSINTAFAAVQCGYFAVSDNANVALNKIPGEYSGFIYNDGDKFRVLAGVYSENDAENIVKNLTGSGVECAKISFNLDINNAVERQIAGICDGYLKVLNTAFKNDVTEVDTEDFKNWTKKLENVDDGQNKDMLTELKSHISDMPNKIKKEDVVTEMQYIYKILSNFTS